MGCRLSSVMQLSLLRSTSSERQTSSACKTSSAELRHCHYSVGEYRRKPGQKNLARRVVAFIAICPKVSELLVVSGRYAGSITRLSQAGERPTDGDIPSFLGAPCASRRNSGRYPDASNNAAR
jgi:hypothetical protein